MAKMFYDDDADLSVIQGRTVAVIGYGSQGHAHALSLRDSGVDVRVGLREGSKSRAKAEAEGLRVLSVADAVEEADLIMVLAPDQEQRKLYTEQIEPSFRPMRTSTPLSRRLRAWAWPWEPKPMTATFLPWMIERSASSS